MSPSAVDFYFFFCARLWSYQLFCLNSPAPFPCHVPFVVAPHAVLLGKAVPPCGRTATHLGVAFWIAGMSRYIYPTICQRTTFFSEVQGIESNKRPHQHKVGNRKAECCVYLNKMIKQSSIHVCFPTGCFPKWTLDSHINAVWVTCCQSYGSPLLPHTSALSPSDLAECPQAYVNSHLKDHLTKHQLSGRTDQNWTKHPLLRPGKPIRETLNQWFLVCKLYKGKTSGGTIGQSLNVNTLHLVQPA